jgi:hypothetical protein
MADRYGPRDGRGRGRDPWWQHEQNPGQGFSAWRGDASDREWHQGQYGGGGYGGWGRGDSYGLAPHARGFDREQFTRRGPDFDREDFDREDFDRDYGQDFGSAYGYERRDFGRNYARPYSARDWRGYARDYGRDDFRYEANEPFTRDWDYAGYGLRADTGPGRYRRGRHAGRGPKGYRRSDDRIREDVNDLLTADPNIDATEIEVRVANGVVTLTGLVEDRSAKRLAEDLAEDVMGVDDVSNQLKVRHGFLAGLTGEKASERELSREPAREAGTISTRKSRSTV